MKNIIFKGSGVAIVTPFDENEINFSEFEKLIEFQISEGTDAIIVCGTTGESATMTEKERKLVIKFVVDTVNKRVPVIAGTGSNCTKSAIEMSKYANEIGADGLLIVTPYYNKTTQQGLIDHYKTIAESVELPIILYNVPSRTGVNILPKTLLELSKIDNIVGIKEASSNISQIAEMKALCGDNINIYSGNDDQIVPIMSIGGIGVISVLANCMPKLVHDMVESYLNGNIKESQRMQLETIEFTKALFSEVNPIPVKSALNFMGYNVGKPRLPLIEMSELGKENLKNVMKKLELI